MKGTALTNSSAALNDEDNEDLQEVARRMENEDERKELETVANKMQGLFRKKQSFGRLHGKPKQAAGSKEEEHETQLEKTNAEEIEKPQAIADHESKPIESFPSDLKTERLAAMQAAPSNAENTSDDAKEAKTGEASQADIDDLNKRFENAEEKKELQAAASKMQSLFRKKSKTNPVLQVKNGEATEDEERGPAADKLLEQKEASLPLSVENQTVESGSKNLVPVQGEDVKLLTPASKSRKRFCCIGMLCGSSEVSVDVLETQKN